MPFFLSGKNKIVVSPSMASTMGVLLHSTITISNSYEKQLSSEIDVLKGLVSAIPNNNSFEIKCHPSFNNWLPFYWENYQQTTSYTYVLKNISNIDEIIKKMHHSKRKNLLKANKKLIIETNVSVNIFYAHHKMTLKKDGKVISYSFQYLQRIVEAARLFGHIEILAAKDSDNIIHSAIVVVYDKISAYYIASSIDSKYRNSGSVTMLIVEAIKIVSSITDTFDFEGSTIQGVELSFRRFGAEQVPYFIISKGSSWRKKQLILFERLARKFGIKE